MNTSTMVVILVAIAVTFLLINACCLQYAANFWLEQTESPHRVSYIGAIGLSFVPVIGQVAVPGAVVTWLLFD